MKVASRLIIGRKPLAFSALTGIIAGAASYTMVSVPIVSIIGQAASSTLYIIAIGTIFGITIVSLFLRQKRYVFTTPQIALLILFFLGLMKIPILDGRYLEAIVSLVVCALVGALAPLTRPSAFLRGVSIVLIIAGVGAAAYTLFNPNFTFARVSGYSEVRLYYLIFSAAVAAALPFSVLAIFIAKRTFSKFISAIVLVFLALALFNGLGRAAFVSGVAAVILTIFSLRALQRSVSNAGSGAHWIVGLVMGSLAGIVFLNNSNTYLSSRLLRLVDFKAELSVGRGELWSHSLRLIAEKPFLGHGVMGAERIMGIYPHNVFLEAWVDLGIVGAACIAAVYGSVVRTVYLSVAGRVHALGVPIVMATLVYAVEGLKSGSLYHSRALFVLCVASSLCVASGRLARHQAPGVSR